jgi:hypothetical protein
VTLAELFATIEIFLEGGKLHVFRSRPITNHLMVADLQERRFAGIRQV